MAEEASKKEDKLMKFLKCPQWAPSIEVQKCRMQKEETRLTISLHIEQ